MMYDLKVSQGGLVNVLAQIKKEFGEYYHTLEEKMRKARTKHGATDKQVEELKQEIKYLAFPFYIYQKTKGFVNTLLARIDDLFRFTQDKDVASDNNLAERGLRKALIIRKISNGSRSEKGAETLEVLLSVLETAKLQKQNPFLFMHKIIASDT
jgi:hypothetical protein